MSIRKNWEIKYTEPDKEIIQSCGGNRVLAALLQNRGINTVEKAKKFLEPLKASLLSPDVFTDMQKAYERVKQAIDNNQHITVYGDFDADGVTSTSLLYLTLKEIGANVDFYLPDRATESHGLNSKALVNLMSKHKTKLIITVDCGISNVKEIAFAKGFKIDVIVTDHHEAPETLPDAYAILNPKAPDNIDPSLSADEIQSLNYLAGVGVAFKFACKLLKEYSKEEFVHKILPLAAVGTIGDVVELIGENRTIVAMGLELIRQSAHKGIDAIFKTAKFPDITKVTSENVTFLVVPRLNAAGRLESPYTAINILISDDEEEIEKSAKTLDDLNTLRQNLCDETFEEAKTMYFADIAYNKKSIILFNEKWHLGIIGIVASKLVENYNKPAFLMTRDPNNTNLIRCSCRSIKDLNVHSILSEHKDVFENFGGHKMAAGFAFDERKISFDNFKKLLVKTIDENSQNIDFKHVSVDVDMLLEPCDITVDTVNLIDKLEPFGSANPSPVFAMEGATLCDYKMMGQDNNHLRMSIRKDNSENIVCVKWNCPNFSIPLNSKLDVLFTLKLNTFNGKTTVQLMVDDIHSEFLEQKTSSSEIKILDHRNKKNIIDSVIEFIGKTKKKTAIFIENPSLIRQLKIPEKLSQKLFSRNDVPTEIEQLMFFDAPPTKEDFYKILNKSGASLIHLMNFDISELNADKFISKLSGMLNYSVSNLKGILSLDRISKALGVSNDTVECALTMFDELQMIDLNKIDEYNFQITYVHPTELSKIKESEMYEELKFLITEVNEFREFYLNSSIDDIKEMIEC